MRFPILMSPMWRPLLLPFGGTPERSYVEMEDGELHVRFGWLFDQRFPLSAIEGASPSHWSVWAGIGWGGPPPGAPGPVGPHAEHTGRRRRRGSGWRPALTRGRAGAGRAASYPSRDRRNAAQRRRMTDCPQA